MNNLTGYQVLGIVYLDQLAGAQHTHISYHNIILHLSWPQKIDKGRTFGIDNTKNLWMVYNINNTSLHWFLFESSHHSLVWLFNWLRHHNSQKLLYLNDALNTDTDLECIFYKIEPLEPFQFRFPSRYKKCPCGNLRRCNWPNSHHQKTIIITPISVFRNFENYGSIELMKKLISLFSFRRNFSEQF